MQEWGLGAGMAAMAFWIFIAAISVAGVWENIRKREAKHETIRRLVESGREIDSEVMDKLIGLTDNKNERPDRMFMIAGLWVLPAALGLVALGFGMGFISQKAELALYAVSGLAAVLGLGFILASKVVGRWYKDDNSSPTA